MLFVHSHKHPKVAAAEESGIFITVEPVGNSTPSRSAAYLWDHSSASSSSSSSSSSGSSRSSLSPSVHSSPNSSPSHSPKMSPRKLLFPHHHSPVVPSLSHSHSQQFHRSSHGKGPDPMMIEANEWSSLVIDTVQTTLTAIDDTAHRMARLSPLDKRSAWFQQLHADVCALRHLLYVADPTQGGSNSDFCTVRDVVQWIRDCQPLMQRITVAVDDGRLALSGEEENAGAQDLRTRFYVCRVRSSNVISQGEALSNNAAMRTRFPNLTWKEISRGGRR